MTETIKYISNNLGDTDRLALAVAKTFLQGALICLYGEIGTGKTTFVKLLAKHINVKEKVTSPSFVILNEYHSGSLDLYHFDLYRLEKEGIESISPELLEYSEKENAFIVIEWAEYSMGVLPNDRAEIYISYLGETSREFQIKLYGKHKNSDNSLNKRL
jgi:tRNA threonylcarbamoyladenosine biosynthesis protein TsaE